VPHFWREGMKKKNPIVPFILLVLFLSLNCNSPNYNFGWEYIFSKRYNEAISIFTDQIIKDKTNYSANYGLGVAYFFISKIDEAIKQLEYTNSLKLTNTEVKYYIGLCYEVKNDFRNAIKYYRYYNDKSLDGKYSSLMEERLLYCIKMLYKEEAKKIINEEKSIGRVLSDSTFAILTFENRSNISDYDVLEKGFPLMFITDFNHVPRLKIIERLRMEAILSELELSKTSLIDLGTIQRVGLLLRAKNILKGGFIINNDQLRLDLALIDVESGKINEQLYKSGKLDDFYRMEKELTLEVIDKLGIKISDQVRQKILTIPTESFFEFLQRIKSLDRIEKFIPKSAYNIINDDFEISLVYYRKNAIEASISDQKDDPRDEIMIQPLPSPPKPPK